MKCWLCERETSLDKGGLNPSEINFNIFNDVECVYCTGRLNFTAQLLAKPELIQLVAGVQKLPSVEGVMVGIRFEEEDE